MIVLDLSILNQKGTPMFNSDLTANRPAAGIVGRIFIAIDAPYGIFRDTGTAWDQISSAGGGATIYTGDGTLTGTRTISSGGFQLVFNPQTTFFSSLTASTGASSFSVLGSNALTFAAGFSSSNIGNVYSANGAINAQNFLGNATFAQANLASAMVNVNKIDFGSGGHTITMTQSTAPGIRAMTGVQNQIQFTGSHNGTISHAAISQNLGFFRESGSTRTLTITNAYSLLLNPLDDYGAGFTFTNRWGIYQAGASDPNYFAGNVGIGTTNTGTASRKLSLSSTSSTYLQFINTSGRTVAIGNDTVGSFIVYDDTAAAYRLVVSNGGNLMVGSIVDNGNRLQVTGDTFLKGSGDTSGTNGFIIQNSSSTELVRVDNSGQAFFSNRIAVNRIQVTSTANQLELAGGGVSATGGDGIALGQFTSVSNTSGIHNRVISGGSFLPTSGTGISNFLQLSGTINQTGGANGITRGLYINPTLTSAFDWRAIEISAGISILAPSTTASATLRVPSGTAPTTPTNGDIWFDGTNLFMRIGGLTKTFTII